jgi:hypothetical protein
VFTCAATRSPSTHRRSRRRAIGGRSTSVERPTRRARCGGRVLTKVVSQRWGDDLVRHGGSPLRWRRFGAPQRPMSSSIALARIGGSQARHKKLGGGASAALTEKGGGGTFSTKSDEVGKSPVAELEWQITGAVKKAYACSV